jgi:hypothetical protein
MRIGDGMQSEPAKATGSWARLGRLLPRGLRARVFEPAYFDLLAERKVGSGLGFGFRVLALALDSYRVGGPHLVWEAARSRKARILLGVTAAAIVALLVIFRLTADYPPAPMP